MGEGTVSGAPAAGSGLSTASSGAAGAAATPVTQEKPLTEDEKQKIVLDQMTPEQRITFWTLEKAEQDAFVNQGWEHAWEGGTLASPGGDNKPLTEAEIAKELRKHDFDKEDARGFTERDSGIDEDSVRADLLKKAAEQGANVVRKTLGL